MKRLFHEKSEIGHFSETKRNYEREYNSIEEEENPNDALDWMEKAKSPKIQAKWDENWKEALKDPAEYSAKHGKWLLIGQSHMDMAWLWRFLQTTDKARVTLTKACIHIENIPEFTFTASQSVMFDWVRIRYPDLFDRVKKHVKSGRIELVGGSWCEPDSHMLSGESWARQRLYGQLFYRKYFNKYATIDWVPDSFGFTNTIPQIMAKSNTRGFLTGKLGNNDATRFPFITFWWQSPDGSRVLAETMNSNNKILKQGVQDSTHIFNYESEDCDNNPNFSDEIKPYRISTYGKGDGGHGPTGSEVQQWLYLHKKKILELSTAEKYFDLVEKELGDRLPVWNDELYLEYHRGTLTSMCIVKRMNRYNEWTLPALESLCTIAKLNFRSNYNYPHEIIDEAWKNTLLMQFHDVLPGTCIPETYDDCWEIWSWLTEQYQQIKNDAFNLLSSKIPEKTPVNIIEIIKQEVSEKSDIDVADINEDLIHPLMVYNPTSFKQNSIIEIPTELFKGELPKFFVTSRGEIKTLINLGRITCPNNKFYELPKRLAFQMELNPLSIDVIYAVNNLELKSELNDNIKESNGITAQVLNNVQEIIEISNNLLKVGFNKSTGAIISLQFKLNGIWKESVLQGKKRFNEKTPILEEGIKIQSFKNLAKDFPAWNLWKESRQNPYESRLVEISIVSQGEKHVVLKTKVEYPTPNSEHHKNTDISYITSYYTLIDSDPMLYLDLKFDFHAQRTLMKLDIPTTTNANRIDAEVAYAYDNRNTLPKTERDKARWENNMHTWVNMQSNDNKWGFAVINNGKYGLDYHGGYMGISLIHGQPYFPPKSDWVYGERFERVDEGLGFPPMWIDQGQHVFRLALYPHQGTLNEADIIPKAHIFNSPPFIHVIDNIDTSNSDQNASVGDFSLPSVSKPLEITAMKPANLDGEGAGWVKEGISIDRVLILRIVNMSPKQTQGKINFSGLSFTDIRACDLLERNIESKLNIIRDQEKINELTDTWNPFEVKTYSLLISD